MILGEPAIHRRSGKIPKLTGQIRRKPQVVWTVYFLAGGEPGLILHVSWGRGGPTPTKLGRFVVENLKFADGRRGGDTGDNVADIRSTLRAGGQQTLFL